MIKKKEQARYRTSDEEMVSHIEQTDDFQIREEKSKGKKSTYETKTINADKNDRIPYYNTPKHKHTQVTLSSKAR